MEKITVWVIAEDGTASVSIEEVDTTCHDGSGSGDGWGIGAGCGDGDGYGWGAGD